MQYLANGMDIPDELIRQHEEGRVVFFCGAGISYESHLPDFKNLTERVFEGIGELKTLGEAEQFKKERYDAVLGSLENRIAMPSRVRRKVHEILTPDAGRTDNSVATHKALVDLATTRDANPTLKLITTNFDLLFEPFLPTSGPGSRRYVAPFLPTPRIGLWNGIVYLHGRFPKDDDETELANLVLTSGDFGRAYLSEAWAARFVSELLRNYVVCFIGYSLGDQTVRYLMDAVEVYKRSGNKTENVYMFVSESSKDDVVFENKSVIRVLYDENACGGHHAMLHKTLQAWADSYTQGLDGKYGIIRKYAKNDPTSIPDDGYVRKMIWALSGDNDKPALYFAKLSPKPSWGWVACLEDAHVFDDNLLNPSDNRNRSVYFTHWILRYMTQPGCILWAVKNRYKLCKSFLRDAEEACNKHQYTLGNECIKLDAFSEKLWRAILTNQIDDGHERSNGLVLKELKWLKEGDWDTLKLKKIGELFTPKLSIEPLVSFYEEAESREQSRLLESLDIGLTLTWYDAAYFATELRKGLKNRLWSTVENISKAFEDGLDLLYYIYGTYDRENDLTFRIRSIEDSNQNKPVFYNIVACVEMIREGWLELLEKDYITARRMAQQWLSSKHPTMCRFGLYAASVSDVIPCEEWVEFFIANEGYMLWQPAVLHEMLRLFATKGGLLTSKETEALTKTIVKGPPACMRITFTNDEKLVKRILDKGKFIRLEKLVSSGAALPEEIASELAAIKNRNPLFRISSDGSDEYVFWSGTYNSENNVNSQDVPNDLEQLVEWLKTDINRQELAEDDYRLAFREACKSRRTLVIEAINLATSRGIWNRHRIVQALTSMMEPDAISDMAGLVKYIVPIMPTEEWRYLANEIGFWCEKAVKTKKLPDGFIAGLAHRFLDFDDYREGRIRSSDKEMDFVANAINHPIGRYVSALVNECFPATIGKGSGISEPYKTLFTKICTSNQDGFFYGRFVLASRSNALYHADEAWTQKNLLALAKWGASNEHEPVAFWQGFLWQKMIYPPILQCLKNEFEETLNHWSSLGMFKNNYLSLLVGLAVYRNPTFNIDELTNIMHKLDVEKLKIAARYIEEQMVNASNADKDPNAFWRENVFPFLQKAWPKSNNLLTDEIVQSLCVAFVTADEELAKGLNDIWFIKPLRKLGFVCEKIQNSNAITNCPSHVLDLLDKVIDNVNNDIEGYCLEKCLTAMKDAAPGIEQNAKFQRLAELSLYPKRHC